MNINTLITKFNITRKQRQHEIEDRAGSYNRMWFLRNKSGHTNPISFLNRITSFSDERNAVDIADLGFTKAFDMVPHYGLLAKLLVL